MFAQSPEPVPQPDHVPIEDPPGDDIPPMEVPPGNEPTQAPPPMRMA